VSRPVAADILRAFRRLRKSEAKIGDIMVTARKWRWLGSVAGALAAGLLFAASAIAQTATAPSGPPITIGFSMALTGSLAVNGKSGLLATQIWAEDVNARGGLLGRPVKLIYYDDQSNPSQVPGIYTKLLDVD
jgi:branched-chain amino acid transport system substrate-binding protein